MWQTHVLGGGDMNFEYIELYNPTNADIDITGWQMWGTK